MKHYSEFKKEINGITDVTDTLKSLEKIAASKVKTIKKKIHNLELYTSEVSFFLERISFFYEDEENFLVNSKKDGDKILLVVTGEKGLVGSLWQKIMDRVHEVGGNYDSILVIGKKGFEKTTDEKIIATLFFSFSDEISLEENTIVLNKKILRKFSEKNTGSIDILYAFPESLSEQKIKIERLLPFEFDGENRERMQRDSRVGLPIFDSTKKDIFDDLLQKYVQTFLFRIILNSKLSENTSKTLEMEHATEKSREVIKKLKTSFRKDNRKKTNQAQLEALSIKK